MTIELKPWDVAEYLDTPERIALYIEAVIDDGDPALLAATLGDIARAGHGSDRQGDRAFARKPVPGALRQGKP